jgi:hypothetical protein
LLHVTESAMQSHIEGPGKKSSGKAARQNVP